MWMKINIFRKSSVTFINQENIESQRWYFSKLNSPIMDKNSLFYILFLYYFARHIFASLFYFLLILAAVSDCRTNHH